jgi:hypothetical protein
MGAEKERNVFRILVGTEVEELTWRFYQYGNISLRQ